MSELAHMLSFSPLLERATTLPSAVVAGAMGGSASAAAAAGFVSGRRIFLYESYGLPEEASSDTLCLAVSYSGHTAETLSFADEALKRGFPLAVVASGGPLLSLARAAGAPAAVVPEGFPPRDALPYLLRAALSLLSEDDALKQLESALPDEDALAKEAEALAALIEGKLPLIYTAPGNALLARIFKMYCNETAKIPAFTGIVPERAHDELQGFDPQGPHKELNSRFAALFIRSARDDRRIVPQLDLYKTFLSEAGIGTRELVLSGDTRAADLIYGWALARDATTLFAKRHGLDPALAPLTASFKQRLSP